MNIIPQVSIIIPCFNNESTIIKTLESTSKQDYNSIEIIIVNDGSTDKSLNVINNLIIDNPNIKVLNQNNLGQSAARNYGADMATGKYLLFLDADDLIAPSFVSKCVNKLEQDKKLNIIYTNADYFDLKKSPWVLPDFTIQNFLESNCIPVTALIRNNVFKKVGKFDENLSYAEDWELWIRIIKEFGGVYKIPETLFFYRKRLDKSSISDNKYKNNKLEKSILYIYNKHYDYFSENSFSIETLLQSRDNSGKYKKKYYNVWYRKMFYKLAKKKKK